MTIGELVETLILVHDRGNLNRREDEAVCEACNILDKLPRQMDVWNAKAELEELREVMA